MIFWAGVHDVGEDVDIIWSDDEDEYQRTASTSLGAIPDTVTSAVEVNSYALCDTIFLLTKKNCFDIGFRFH